VVIQTLNPTHPAIIAAANHDYKTFYENEIAMRRAGRFPPFTFFVNCIISSTDPKQVSDVASHFIEMMKQRVEQVRSDRYLDVLGPTVAPFAMMHGKHRWFVAARGTRLSEVLDVCGETYGALTAEEQKCVAIDVNPADML
jgi:primosomal protein N' (replication factor Y) (superfamily II helicase)